MKLIARGRERTGRPLIVSSHIMTLTQGSAHVVGRGYWRRPDGTQAVPPNPQRQFFNLGLILRLRFFLCEAFFSRFLFFLSYFVIGTFIKPFFILY